MSTYNGFTGNDFTLSDAFYGSIGSMASPEGELQKMIAQMNSSTGSASTMSVTDMVELQYQMSVYSIAASTISGVVKEAGDTLKGVIQKF